MCRVFLSTKTVLDSGWPLVGCVSEGVNWPSVYGWCSKAREWVVACVSMGGCNHWVQQVYFENTL